MFGKKKVEEQQDYDTAATHGCTTDQWLRQNGFTIRHRLKNQPAIWERNGIRFTATEALELIVEETAYAPESRRRSG